MTAAIVLALLALVAVASAGPAQLIGNNCPATPPAYMYLLSFSSPFNVEYSRSRSSSYANDDVVVGLSRVRSLSTDSPGSTWNATGGSPLPYASSIQETYHASDFGLTVSLAAVNATDANLPSARAASNPHLTEVTYSISLSLVDPADGVQRDLGLVLLGDNADVLRGRAPTSPPSRFGSVYDTASGCYDNGGAWACAIGSAGQGNVKSGTSRPWTSAWPTDVDVVAVFDPNSSSAYRVANLLGWVIITRDILATRAFDVDTGSDHWVGMGTRLFWLDYRALTQGVASGIMTNGLFSMPSPYNTPSSCATGSWTNCALNSLHHLSSKERMLGKMGVGADTDFGPADLTATALSTIGGVIALGTHIFGDTAWTPLRASGGCGQSAVSRNQILCVEGAGWHPLLLADSVATLATWTWTIPSAGSVLSPPVYSVGSTAVSPATADMVNYFVSTRSNSQIGRYVRCDGDFMYMSDGASTLFYGRPTFDDGSVGILGTFGVGLQSPGDPGVYAPANVPAPSTTLCGDMAIDRRSPGLVWGCPGDLAGGFVVFSRPAWTGSAWATSLQLWDVVGGQTSWQSISNLEGGVSVAMSNSTIVVGSVGRIDIFEIDYALNPSNTPFPGGIPPSNYFRIIRDTGEPAFFGRKVAMSTLDAPFHGTSPIVVAEATPKTVTGVSNGPQAAIYTYETDFCSNMATSPPLPTVPGTPPPLPTSAAVYAVGVVFQAAAALGNPQGATPDDQASVLRADLLSLVNALSGHVSGGAVLSVKAVYPYYDTAVPTTGRMHRRAMMATAVPTGHMVVFAVTGNDVYSGGATGVTVYRDKLRTALRTTPLPSFQPTGEVYFLPIRVDYNLEGFTSAALPAAPQAPQEDTSDDAGRFAATMRPVVGQYKEYDETTRTVASAPLNTLSPASDQRYQWMRGSDTFSALITLQSGVSVEITPATFVTHGLSVQSVTAASASAYTVVVALDPAFEGEAVLGLPAGRLVSTDGRTNERQQELRIFVDRTPPTVSFDLLPAYFSDPVLRFDLIVAGGPVVPPASLEGKIVVTGATVRRVAASFLSATRIRVLLEPATTGSLVITIPAGALTDVAGNSNPTPVAATTIYRKPAVSREATEDAVTSVSAASAGASAAAAASSAASGAGAGAAGSGSAASGGTGAASGAGMALLIGSLQKMNMIAQLEEPSKPAMLTGAGCSTEPFMGRGIFLGDDGKSPECVPADDQLAAVAGARRRVRRRGLFDVVGLRRRHHPAHVVDAGEPEASLDSLFAVSSAEMERMLRRPERFKQVLEGLDAVCKYYAPHIAEAGRIPCTDVHNAVHGLASTQGRRGFFAAARHVLAVDVWARVHTELFGRPPRYAVEAWARDYRAGAGSAKPVTWEILPGRALTEEHRRKVLQDPQGAAEAAMVTGIEDATDHLFLGTAEQMIAMAILVGVETAVQVFATLVWLYLRRRRGRTPRYPSQLLFPRIQVYTLYFFVPAIAQTAGALITDDRDGEQALGWILLLAIPIPMVLYCAWIVYSTQVAMDSCYRGIFYEVDEKEAQAAWHGHRPGPWTCLGIWRRAPVGEWKGRNSTEMAFFTRFGVIFEDYHGPYVVRKNCTWELDPVIKRINRGYLEAWYPDGKYSVLSTLFAYGCAFNAPLRVTFMFLLALVSSVASPTEGEGQIAGFIVLTTINVLLLLTFQPYASGTDQLVDALQSTCEYVSVWLLLGIVVAVNTIDDPADRADTAKLLGDALMVVLVVGLSVSVISQVYDVACELADFVRFSCSMRMKPAEMLHRVVEEEVEDKRARILGKMYANRWANAALGRPISGWPRLGPLSAEEEAYVQRTVAEHRVALYKNARLRFGGATFKSSKSLAQSRADAVDQESVLLLGATQRLKASYERGRKHEERIQHAAERWMSLGNIHVPHFGLSFKRSSLKADQEQRATLEVGDRVSRDGSSATTASGRSGNAVHPSSGEESSGSPV
ncbi:unnamed protein product [Pedinophyceae sp. YPF-701]|nr:unnamed protein product [Pedinophyceae sp. YPF-701]